MDVILGAFAALPGYRTGEQQNTAAASYYRCIVVALGSAKAQNPGCTAALITNTPVPAPFAAQLTAAGVEVWEHAFDTFTMPQDAPWSLAFYKLCALDWALREKPFDRYLMLDVGTYTQRPFTDIWREAEEAVLLYQTPHAASQPMAAAISAHYDALAPETAPATSSAVVASPTPTMITPWAFGPTSWRMAKPGHTLAASVRFMAMTTGSCSTHTTL